MKRNFLKQRQSLPLHLKIQISKPCNIISPNKFELMRETHPKLHDYCINKLGCGRVLDFIGVKH